MDREGNSSGTTVISAVGRPEEPMNRHAVRMLLVVASFAIALNAFAVTEMQVAAAAADLKSDYLELEPRVEAGTESHATLETEFDALEARRVSLESDRA